MATKKTKAPAKAVAQDSTYLTECRAILAFNSACNAEIVINTESMTVSVNVVDHVNSKTYATIADLEEVN